MNLSKLFEIQKKLDDRIVEEHGLQGQDLLDKKILALQVELGELAQNWRGFKFWSHDQTARTESDNLILSGAGVVRQNPLLEEYVDCLHFILSIGLELGTSQHAKVHYIPEKNITDSFLSVFECVSDLDVTKSGHGYLCMFNRFIELGVLLGFNWEQIEQAYMDKNQINHNRQDEGY